VIRHACGEADTETGQQLSNVRVDEVERGTRQRHELGAHGKNCKQKGHGQRLEGHRNATLTKEAGNANECGSGEERDVTPRIHRSKCERGCGEKHRNEGRQSHGRSLTPPGSKMAREAVPAVPE
jgi:hypothetical protein